jgi:hypothetical protein
MALRQGEPMETDARLFNCARCHCQVVICSHCDRGQIYCGVDCAQLARAASLRAAGDRYQRSRQGRFTHAARQRRYRQRQQQKVTHQGSPASGSHASLVTQVKRQVPLAAWPADRVDEQCICHFCGRICSFFLRLDFRRRRPAVSPGYESTLMRRGS